MRRELLPQLHSPVCPAELRERLAALRETLDFLQRWAAAGAELRCYFQAAGSATWEPGDDLLWERWITTYGDERMRQYLAELDAECATTCANDEIAPS